VLRMSPARRTILLQGQFFRRGLSVFSRRIVFAFAFVASKTNKLPHGDLSLAQSY
jgi:hypothetical protein